MNEKTESSILNMYLGDGLYGILEAFLIWNEHYVSVFSKGII